MKGLSEKRLSDYMAEQIADEILAGRIEGGSQLKQEESNRGKGSIFDGNKTGPVASCTDGEWISDESAEKCFGVLYPVCHKM